MQSSHTPTRRFTPVFDEDHLVSAGGLPAVMGLAQRAGLADLLSPDPPLWGWFWGVGTEKMPLLIWDNGCW